MNDHVASLYGVTDYALEVEELSNAGIVDFQAVPDDWLDPGWWASAFPGVVTHDGFDGEAKAAYLGRLCCPQWVGFSARQK